MIAVVIPVYNETSSLQPLYEEVVGVAKEAGLAVHIIFVDDGSSDGSREVIRQLAQQDDRVEGIFFRRNFGKAAALSAGFRAARGRL